MKQLNLLEDDMKDTTLLSEYCLVHRLIEERESTVLVLSMGCTNRVH